MSAGLSFVMAGGGTGGHIIPAIAVADELRRHGYESFFIGTQRGMESRLVPAAGFPIEWIEIGGFNRVGAAQRIRTLAQIPMSTMRVLQIFHNRKPRAVFSMGGYVAGPVMLAARLAGIPMVVMEPNAIPGMTNRRMGRWIKKALVSFPEALEYFPQGRAEITGMPVREEFFKIPPRTEPRVPFTILITGGSRGSKTLNEAARGSWNLFAQRMRVRIVHQCGTEMFSVLESEFRDSGVSGEVMPFVNDMPKAFDDADLIVCRSGASTVSELAAAGKPSILVPFPFAADDHQLRNAEAMVGAGASRLVLDREMNGQRLFDEVLALASAPQTLQSMSANARAMARPGAASRAAHILEELAVR
ncbi:MAG: undecaprenyldiphospho-muramoylpentapeptide beta-N-acetylglucosaminyltransferase [Bryobacteraceae bacterium]